VVGECRARLSGQIRTTPPGRVDVFVWFPSSGFTHLLPVVDLEVAEGVSNGDRLRPRASGNADAVERGNLDVVDQTLKHLLKDEVT